jgi:LacI family transcriptional regulator
MNDDQAAAAPDSGDAGQNARSADYHKTITMATIARAAGVSQGAISSLLNDRDYGIRVSEKTRERVFRVCRELGYIPNDLRAVVRMYPEKGDLCLLISGHLKQPLLDGFTARVASAALEHAHIHSRHLTIAAFDPTADYLARPDLLPQPVRSGTVSKFLCGGTTNASLYHALLRRGYPAVSLGHDVPVPGVTSIVPDYSGGAQLAIERLFDLGHQRIVVLSGPFGTADSQVIELNRGVSEGFSKRGVAIDQNNVVYGDLTFEGGFAACEQLLTRPSPPTAIFCLKDAAAAGALAAAMARGVQVPQQLSIIGCSDDPIARESVIGISTIHLPAEELGSSGVAEVEQRVRDIGKTDVKRVVLPIHFVERQTTAPAAS